jgi:hypothetical protein
MGVDDFGKDDDGISGTAKGLEFLIEHAKSSSPKGALGMSGCKNDMRPEHTPTSSGQTSYPRQERLIDNQEVVRFLCLLAVRD